MLLATLERSRGFNSSGLLPKTKRFFYLFSSDASRNDDSSSKRQQIVSMILSLAEETDDSVRRQNLSKILKEKLQQPDAAQAAQFAILWDKTVIEVGTQVQEDARINAERQIAIKNEKSMDCDMEDFNGNVESTTKSHFDLKLWAMVDMMIQSKQIIKTMMTE